MNAHPLNQGPRYLLVAAFCATLHNAIMIALDRAGAMYGVGLLVSAAVLVPTGFVLQASFTFGAERNWPAFRRYTAAMAASLPVAFVVVWLLYDIAGLPMFVAAPLSTAATLVWNFIISKRALVPTCGERAAMGTAK